MNEEAKIVGYQLFFVAGVLIFIGGATQNQGVAASGALLMSVLFIVPHFIHRRPREEVEDNALEKLLWPKVTVEELADIMPLKTMRELSELYAYGPERDMLNEAMILKKAIEIISTGLDPLYEVPRPKPQNFKYGASYDKHYPY